jgi:hypothetical protein
LHAYVFLRKSGAPLPIGCAGHVGWGVTLADGTIVAGSTENTSGEPFVPPGHANGHWDQVFATQADLVSFLGNGTGERPAYDALKILGVRNADPERAAALGRDTANWGYTAMGNNCADHVWKVLEAYGEVGLPLLQTHPSPNEWFALVVGEYVEL